MDSNLTHLIKKFYTYASTFTFTRLKQKSTICRILVVFYPDLFLDSRNRYPNQASSCTKLLVLSNNLNHIIKKQNKKTGDYFCTSIIRCCLGGSLSTFLPHRFTHSVPSCLFCHTVYFIIPTFSTSLFLPLLSPSLSLISLHLLSLSIPI